MEPTGELSFQELKRQALMRRSDKLMEWLHRPEYAQYIDAASTEHLAKLIDLVIWALEKSLPPIVMWRPFLRKFGKARKIIMGLPEEEEIEEWDEKANYDQTVAILLDTLYDYKACIKDFG